MIEALNSRKRTLDVRLWLAQRAQARERHKLDHVMEDPDVWTEDGPYVNEDIVKAARIVGLQPAELAGYAEVIRRVKAVRGTTGEVARLAALLNHES